MNLRTIALSSVALVGLVAGAFAAEGTPPGQTPLTEPTTTPSTAPTTEPAITPSTPSTAPSATEPSTAADPASATEVTAVTDPTKTLKSAAVEAQDGTKVGQVSKVRVNANGVAESLDVKIGKKTVSLPAAKAKYNSSTKTVVAQLSADDLKALPKPGTTTSSSNTIVPEKPDTKADPAPQPEAPPAPHTN